MRRHLTRLTAAAVTVTALSACSSGPRQTGVRIGDETLKQLEAGITTEEWLVAILGPPTEQSVVAGLPSTRVFRYSLGEESGGLTSFITGGSTKNTAVIYFIITDGVMTRYWADREVETPLIGSPVPSAGGQKQ